MSVHIALTFTPAFYFYPDANRLGLFAALPWPHESGAPNSLQQRDEQELGSSLSSRTRTKIVLVTANGTWNIAHFRTSLIKALQDAGFRVICAAPEDGHSAQLVNLGCRFEPLSMDTMGTSPVEDMKLFLRYLGLFRRIRPDVVLSFTVKPNVYGSIAASMLGIPVINNVTGLGTAFIENNWLTFVVTRLYKIAFRKSSRVFVQNRDDERLLIELGVVRRDTIEVLPGSGIDLSKFTPVQCASRGEESHFLLIGRLLWDKGVREFADAARILKNEYPRASFRLLGPVDVENRSSIPRSEIEKWVAEGIVDYLGPTNDVRPFIADADCVVLPSHREGTPRTLLEAAAMARPLIATDVPGCREPVHDGENGLLCRVRSADDLARAMRDFLKLGVPARVAMGQASRRIAEERYDERIVITAYLQAVHASLAGVANI